MQSGIAQRYQIGGWSFSLVFHGVLLGAIALFPHLPTVTPQEPFRWDVLLAELPQQPTTTERDRTASPNDSFLRPNEAEVNSSVSPTTTVSRPPQQANDNSPRVAEGSEDIGPLSATATTPMAQAQPEVVPQKRSTMKTTVATQEMALTEQPETIIAPTPVVGSEPPARPIAQTEQELPLARTAAEAAMTQARSMDQSPVSAQTAVSPAAPIQSLTSQADYSWLQQALSRRLEDLKRSSQPSLENSNRLKVLVRAVVSGRGDLMEAEVVKSSGLERIDREAMTLVQRAFPLSLDQTLDQPQIVMRIPITYSRD